MVVTVGTLRAIDYRKSQQLFTSSGEAPHVGGEAKGADSGEGNILSALGWSRCPRWSTVLISGKISENRRKAGEHTFPGATDLVRRVV